MGLRDFLMNAERAQALTRGAAEAGEGFRRQSALLDLTEQAPEQLAGGPEDLRNLAAQAASAGQGGPLTALFRQQLAGMAPSVDPAVIAKVSDPNASEEEVSNAIASVKDPTMQRSLITRRSAVINASLRGRGLEIQQEGEERRQQERPQRQREAFAKDFDKEFKALQQEQRTVDKVQAAFKKGSVPGDAVVFNFIARNVAGERGPLSDNDIARLASRAFEGDMQRLQNFLSGGTTAFLTPEQRQAFYEIIQVAANNFENFKKDRLGSAIEFGVSTFPKLRDEKTGRLDEAILARAKRAGFEVKDGRVIIKKEKEGATGDRAESFVAFESAVKGITDPVKKQKWDRILTRARQNPAKFKSELALERLKKEEGL